MQFSPINFLAVAIGTLAGLLFGLLWYAPQVFGRAWQKHTGLTDEQIRTGSILLKFGPAIIFMFVMGVALAAFMPTGLHWDHGAFGGMVMGGGVGATAIGLHYLFAKRSINLFLIDAGYIVITMTMFGAIIAAMS